MKKLCQLSAFFLLAAIMFAACDDNTLGVGSDIMPAVDRVSSTRQTFTLNSTSVRVDSVLANTNSCYLGSIIDPETNAKTTCDFLAQFHVLENLVFPSRDRLYVNPETGFIEADSCKLRIEFKDYYGDSLATMKLTVTELDTNRVMQEGQNYYTDLAPADYVSTTSPYTVSQTYSLRNVSRLPSTAINYNNIVINLPKEYGTYILRKYYERPDFFENSYQFIRHVCPGFYFQTSGGVGSILHVNVSALDVYFRYHTTNPVTGADTIVNGLQRMAATEEVIQNTHIENTLPASMLDNTMGYTYLKSPAGIFTEVELPVGDVVAGTHYTDTINAARIAFPRINPESETEVTLAPPATLLMLRKSEMFSFFEQGKVADGRTSFITDFSNSYNAYVYSNIAPLLTRMKNERDAGAGVSRTESEASRLAKYAAWEAAHPDWNKVVLIPVQADYITNTTSTTSTKTLLRVRNELGLASAKLVGGDGGNLSLDVTYSRFETE